MEGAPVFRSRLKTSGIFGSVPKPLELVARFGPALARPGPRALAWAGRAGLVSLPAPPRPGWDEVARHLGLAGSRVQPAVASSHAHPTGSQGLSVTEKPQEISLVVFRPLFLPPTPHASPASTASGLSCYPSRPCPRAFALPVLPPEIDKMSSLSLSLAQTSGNFRHHSVQKSNSVPSTLSHYLHCMFLAFATPARVHTRRHDSLCPSSARCSPRPRGQNFVLWILCL